MSAIIAKITAWFFTLINLFLGLVGKPTYPTEMIDMNKFNAEPVFYDEFDGSSVNTDYWAVLTDPASVRRGGYWSDEMVSVSDGALHIRTQYVPQGIDGQGAGWYSGAVKTQKEYESKFGYYECRCKLPAGEGLWSAFWLNCDGMSVDAADGTSGEEIDIFEAPHYYDLKKRNCVESAVHYGGYGDAHRSSLVGTFVVQGDPYNEYHTYGMEWNAGGYTFYIDGKKTGFSNFGGASQVPEQMILSVEVGGQNATPAKDWPGRAIDINGKDFTADFAVDYVKIYSYK